MIAGYLDIVRYLCETGGAGKPVSAQTGEGTVPGVDMKSKGGWTALSEHNSTSRSAIQFTHIF